MLVIAQGTFRRFFPPKILRHRLSDLSFIAQTLSKGLLPQDTWYSPKGDLSLPKRLGHRLRVT